MFLMIGVNQDQRELDFSQMVVCDECGAYGRYQLYMTYTVLTLFLIPLLRWNRRYYVRMSCCGALYELDGEIGKRIAQGEKLEIRPEQLHSVHPGSHVRRCADCGFTTQEDYDFCPKCGRRL